MNNIVMGLSYIEDTARLFEANAEDAAADYPRRLEDARIKINARVKKETDALITKMQSEICDETERIINKLNAEAESRRACIERQYEENGARWEEEIFNCVIGRYK